MNNELILYYINLLILQYRKLPNAQAHILAIATELTIYDLIKQVEAGYNIDSSLGDTAVGVQLDVIAKYVGAERIVTGVDFTRTYFGFVDYAEPTPYVNVEGLLEYDEINPPDAQMLTYETGDESIYTLTDSELLIIIKLKIAQNNSNHSNAEIDEILENFLTGQVIFTDEENMTISYIFDEQARRLAEIAEAQGALPKPAAVGILISYVEDINNIFGMLKYSSTDMPDFLQGMNKYSDDPFGSFLTY